MYVRSLIYCSLISFFQMFTHVSQLPVREWLEDAHAATVARGYANAGNVETFEMETKMLFVRLFLLHI